MRKIAFAIAVAMILGTAASFAKAEESVTYGLDDYELDSARDLLDVCTVSPLHDDHDVAKAFCVGFFAGGLHFHDAVSGTPNFPRIACAPKTTTREEVVDTFVTYVRGHTQYLTEPPMQTVFRAVVNKWPCDN